MDDIRSKRTNEEKARDAAAGEDKTFAKDVGAGVAGGGLAGAAIGLAGGPVGAVVGAVIGAAAGGLAGAGIAEMVDEHVEDAYWRDSYVGQPYFTPGTNYDYYRPAYRAGWEGRVRYAGRTFEESEDKLRADYERARTEANAEWSDARLAAKAAWDRIEDMKNNAR